MPIKKNEHLLVPIELFDELIAWLKLNRDALAARQSQPLVAAQLIVAETDYHRAVELRAEAMRQPWFVKLRKYARLTCQNPITLRKAAQKGELLGAFKVDRLWYVCSLNSGARA
jgi:hypothetical protein